MQSAENAPEQVKIFDTTLRDGEQSPRVSWSVSEKLQIALQLQKLRVDVIEAGFPIASPDDFRAVQTISREVREPVICALARAAPSDITRAAEALREAERPRIHTFVSTSDIHITHQLQSTREDVRGLAAAAVAQAKSLVDDVEFSPMDATRADPDFTVEVCQIAVREGATTINIPDTVGYSTPEEYGELIAHVRAEIPQIQAGRVTLSVHCHNDLGLAVANSYSGILAGARQVESAVNGIGERAGNCSTEEIVMLLATRGTATLQRTGRSYRTSVETTQIAESSRLISRLSGYAVQPNKAIVGRNAFAHESGIHQDGVLKERSTYEIMSPSQVGLESNELVLGKHSGRHALAQALTQLGHPLEGGELNAIFREFKELTARKREITSADLIALAQRRESAGSEPQPLEWDWFEVESGSAREPLARVLLRDSAGQEHYGAGRGDGPVEAVFEAVLAAARAAGVISERASLRFSELQINSVTEGEDALAEASVVVSQGDQSRSGRGLSPDVVGAAGEAYLMAVNRLTRGALWDE